MKTPGAEKHARKKNYAWAKDTGGRLRTFAKEIRKIGQRDGFSSKKKGL